jgi:hypothetical protein
MNISKQKIDTIDLLANCNTISMTVDTIDSRTQTHVEYGIQYSKYSSTVD